MLTFNLVKAQNKDGKDYEYYSLGFVKKDGTIVEIKRVFLTALEKEAIKLLEMTGTK